MVPARADPTCSLTCVREKVHARPDTDEGGELSGGNGEGVLVAGADPATRVGAGDHRRPENIRSEDARGRMGRGARATTVFFFSASVFAFLFHLFWDSEKKRPT